MPTLIAHRQLVGDYGRVAAGGTFSTSAAVADRLLARGLASIAEPTEDPPALLALRKAVLEVESSLSCEWCGSVIESRSGLVRQGGDVVHLACALERDGVGGESLASLARDRART